MRGPPTAGALAVLALLVGAGMVADTLLPLRVAGQQTATRDVSPASGAWYCAVGDTDGGDGLQVVAAALGTTAASGDVRIDTFTGGGIRRGPEREVFAGTAASDVVRADLPAVGVMARWWRTPVAVGRTWTRATPGAPRGTVAGPCEAQPSSRWIFPGLSTAGGGEAHLVLGNPFETDASASVHFATPEGRLGRELLENVVVSGRSVRDVLLNEHVPERSDLGVVVTVRSGRVVAEGFQTVSPAVDGVEGATLAKAVTSGATTWTVPWFAGGGEGVASWLWVTNVGDSPAAVTATLHTSEGATAPRDLEELALPPDQVRRVDLVGVLPEGRRHGGITVRSANGVPIVAAVATRAAIPDRTGLALQLGAAEGDTRWLLPGGATAGRSHHLELVNPGGEVASVDVAVWTPSGVARPGALQGIRIGPGASASLELDPHLGEADNHALFVTATTGSVVASERSLAVTGRMDLEVTQGVAASTWRGGAPAPSVRFAPGLPQRIGTELGPAGTPPGPGGGTEEDGQDDTGRG